jgi:hypothetical protein
MSKYNLAINKMHQYLFIAAFWPGAVAFSQQLPPCINQLIDKTARENSVNPCQGGAKLLGIEEYAYQGTALFKLVFERKTPCPDYVNTTVFYDAGCQLKIKISDGGIAYRHQVSPSGINEKEIKFVKRINWTNEIKQPSNIRVTNNLTIEANGVKLKTFYLALNVENLWIAGNHVNWQTGEADKPDATAGIHTHCSAFVAAACKKLAIYILRPPEHKQELLSNAQFDWLSLPQAVNAGWKKIEGNNVYVEAQSMANRGIVVIAICKNPDNTKPGHVAMVMPGEVTNEKLENDGPNLIMAGTHNFNKISLKAGFKSHLTSWPENVVQFYYNTNTSQFPVQPQ